MKLLKYFNTIKYLKAIQIYYRLYYFIRDRYFPIQVEFQDKVGYRLNLLPSIYSYSSYTDKNSFKFINLSHKFDSKIDWNYSDFGKLWTYNLNYFEYLNQKDFNTKEGIYLINDYIQNLSYLKDGLEPFPISLRGLNWIKFLTYKKIEDKNINSALYAQYEILSKNLEYHLLGNHLLENAFSLLFAAYYFRDINFLKKAKKILQKELNRQILNDGAHFELSPMYHQLMLFRLLDCINLLSNNSWSEDIKFKNFLNKKASLMLGYLEQITFNNGEIPLVNDSANEIAPTTKELKEYAKTLKIEPIFKKLTSGYEMAKTKNFELFIDSCDVKAKYIPGHTHSDIFNFLLNINNQEFIVDSGVSTYEANSTRAYERSSKAHNCIVIKDENTDDVWGAFRVANRARVMKKEEMSNYILAQHSGYIIKFQTIIERAFIFSDNKIIILNKLIGKSKKAKAMLHINGNIDIELKKDVILTNNGAIIKFFEYNNINLKKGYRAKKFNEKLLTHIIEIEFEKELKMEVIL